MGQHYGRTVLTRAPGKMDLKALIDVTRPDRSRFDRLTLVLALVAIVLVAAVAALGADLWLRPTQADSAAKPVAPSPVLARSTESAASIPAATPSSTRVTESVAEAPTHTPLPSPTAVPSPSAPVAPTDVLTLSVTPPACVPPDDWAVYSVQTGNTLYSIARRFGTDVDTLMRVNCLNTTTIFPEQRLYVPGSVSVSVAVTPFPTTVFTQPVAAQSLISPTLDGQAQVGVGTPQPAPKVQGALRVSIPDRYINIVLLGSDKRPRSGAWRTDSMIVVSVDPETSIVRLLSIPRDLWVFIPGHGYNRVNTADLWGELADKGGGPERVKQTIYYNLGIPVHYYVRVDFQGFMKIIDAVGGVDIDVDCPLPDISLTAGMHHMNGQQALRYSRSRYSSNDFDRGRRQRKVLMALWEQALTLDLIPKLPGLWRAMSDSYQTDLPLDQVINLAYVGARLKPQRILSRAIGPAQVQSWITPEGASVLLPRQDRIRTLLESYYGASDPTSLDASEQVRVQVLNGWQRRDAEQLAAAALRWGGFRVAGTGATEDRGAAQSQILVYTGNKAAGDEVADLLNLPVAAVVDRTGIEAPPVLSGPVDLVIILGQDYDPCSR